MSSKSKKNKNNTKCLLTTPPKTEPKAEPVISPEKQQYLDRCDKRMKTLAKLKSRRKVRKIGINFVPSEGDAPCAFMVERVKKEATPNVSE